MSEKFSTKGTLKTIGSERNKRIEKPVGKGNETPSGRTWRRKSELYQVQRPKLLRFLVGLSYVVLETYM